MNHNRYEMDKLNEMNMENVALMMEQYGAPSRKKRPAFRLSLRALLARIPGGWQRPDGRLFRDTVRWRLMDITAAVTGITDRHQQTLAQYAGRGRR